MKLADQNLDLNKNNQEMDISDLHLQTGISNVKIEANPVTLIDNLSGNRPLQSVANDDVEIQFRKDNLDKQFGQSTIENHLASVSETRIVPVTGGIDPKKYADPKNANGVKLTMSDLLKSVKMPNIILERIKIVGHKFDISVVNSNQTHCESRQKNLDETLFKDDAFSVHSFDPKSPEDGTLLKCFYCEKTFTQECHRTLHHKTHKLHHKIYKRPLDKQKFVYQSNQKICQITPTGKNPFYKCSYCEKVFSKPRNLQIHTRTHTGEKPFKCSVCNSRFNQSNNLQRHERIHTGEKPFKRSFCNARFNDPQYLRSHERIHTGERPFKCSFCNNRFTQLGSRKTHERTHTGEKPFKCSFCGHSFNGKSNLIVHERIHTGEKPYKCLYCEKMFNGIRDKMRHQKRHLKQLPFLVEQEEQIHCAGPMEFKCSFCEMTFINDEERSNHEKMHRREDEILNENIIVGI